MWDSNSPLQLLNSMPRKLTKENLERLQLVIDADKYKNSLVSGFDLCGMYAPFCRGCKKTSIYPCAIAYVNMMKNGGMDIEIDAKPVETAAPAAEAAVKSVEADAEIAATEERALDETEEPAVKANEEAAPAFEEPHVPAPQKDKRKIRIAIARRKIII